MNKKSLLVVLLVGLGVAAAAESRTIEIRARKFSYSPNIVRVAKGETITVRLISEDVMHGFYLDGYGIETHSQPGSDGSLTFTADKTGRFNYRCSVTCGEFHPFMVGYFVVTPNTRFYAFAGLVGLLGLGSAVGIFLRKKKGSDG